MKNDTKIYVSKKAAEIVDTIKEAEVATVKKMYVCIFIDGSQINDTSYLQMQKRIAQINKVNRDGIIAAAKKKLDEEAKAIKAEIAATEKELETVTTKSAKKNSVDKVNYANSNAKKNAEEKADRARELKRARDRRYRQNNLEAVRQRDKEYRRRKRAEIKAQAKGIEQ